MRIALKLALDRIAQTDVRRQADVLYSTGPGLLTDAVKQCQVSESPLGRRVVRAELLQHLTALTTEQDKQRGGLPLFVHNHNLFCDTLVLRASAAAGTPACGVHGPGVGRGDI
jgi:hypothetical protein